MVAGSRANHLDALVETTTITFTPGPGIRSAARCCPASCSCARSSERAGGARFRRQRVRGRRRAAGGPDALRRVRPQQPPRAHRARGRRADLAPRGAPDDERLLPDRGSDLLLRRRGTLRPLRPMFVLLLDAFARARDDRGALRVRFFRRTRGPGDPVGDVRDARCRAARVPRSAAERSPWRGRPSATWSSSSERARPRRPARLTRPRAARSSLAGARILAARLRCLRRPRREAGRARISKAARRRSSTGTATTSEH